MMALGDLKVFLGSGPFQTSPRTFRASQEYFNLEIFWWALNAFSDIHKLFFQTQIPWNSWIALSLFLFYFKPLFCPCTMTLSHLPQAFLGLSGSFQSSPKSFWALDPFQSLASKLSKVQDSFSFHNVPDSLRVVLRHPRYIFGYPKRLFRPPISLQVYTRPVQKNGKFCAPFRPF